MQQSHRSGYQPTANDVLAARRLLAKRDLKWFARMVEIPTVPVSENAEEDRFETLAVDELALHHDVLLGNLQDLADGRIRNLMVLMPPGSAKSTYVDVVFVPWFMARNPKQNVILSSYGTGLAKKQGRRARQLVKSKSFGVLFPDVALSAESAAADEWSLSNGSEYMAGGILSGITGNRADLLAIDDPIKGRDEAESETVRRKTWEAYTDDLQTRLKPGGRTVLITTRWHGDDPAGKILPEDWAGESGDIECRDGQVWRVLCIPARANRPDDPLGRANGEYLWPEWFDTGHWAKFEANARTWASLFQQVPSPEEGTFFQRDWFKRHDTAPKGGNIYITSDYAVSDGKGDYTEHYVWSHGSDDKITLLDGWYGQTTADVWIEELLNLTERWKPLCVFGEGGVIEKAVKPQLVSRMRSRRVFARMEWITSAVDKPSRARSFQAQAAMGDVSLPKTEFGERILTQLLQFPAGKHDDGVDCCSLMGRVIDLAHPAIVAPQKPKAKRDMWDDDFEVDSDGDSWKVA